MTTPSASPTPAVLTALQAALAAEHAAVYGYGVVGAHLTGSRLTTARAAFAAHQAHRDALQRELTARHTTPTPAAPGYQLPFPVTDPASAVQLATLLEDRLTAVHADLVTAATGDLRRTAADALREAAVRAARWRGHPTGPAFPGLPERTATPTPTAPTPTPQ
ncbi:ferritin-like domain-containing protein [Peterkaempfera bronchialis]|uniref:ferritin-like domain-containing protein n=1 Tax=Peterkaempfera bronchialis TaxID=2126346 RepID=UPI003C2FF1B0